MKTKGYFLVMVFLLAGLSSCKKIKESLTEFDITYHNSATIAATVPLNVPFDIPLPSVTTNTEEEFENNNTHKDLAKEIHLKTLELTVTDPADGDFGFLRNIEIYISADGLREKKIAWKLNIPDNIGGTLELETTSEDLKEYLFADKFKLRVRVTTDRLITRDYDIDIKTVFHVKANIFGS